MKSIIATLIVTGLFLVGFALGRSPKTAEPVMKLLRFGKTVGSRTADHMGDKVRHGLSRLVDRNVSDDEMNEESLREIDRDYYRLRDCLQAQDDFCPGFNLTSYRDYQNDVRAYMIERFNDYYNFLKANRLDIEERDEKLARLLLDDVEEGIQAIGLKMIGLFPLSRENLQIIAARLSLTMDDELFRDGIEFLYQHKSNPEVVKEAEKIFLRQIRYGPSDETAARAAIAAFDFMNEQNVRSFERLRAEMEPFPFRFNAIDSSIREFERRSSHQAN